jgi:hypothetical protein
MHLSWWNTQQQKESEQSLQILYSYFSKETDIYFPFNLIIVAFIVKGV